MVDYIFIDKKVPKINVCACCIGYFDGVHLGHQRLIKETITYAKKKGIDANAILFNTSNNRILKNTGNIQPLDVRIEVIKHFGINNVIVIDLNEEIMKLSDEEFINKYLNNFQIDTLFCGEDYHFGYKAMGNYNTLRKGNYNVTAVDEILYNGIKISSRDIRKYLKEGDIKLINKLLGYKYFIKVRIIDCKQYNSMHLIKATYFDEKAVKLKDKNYNYFYIQNNFIYFYSNCEHTRNEIYYL